MAEPQKSAGGEGWWSGGFNLAKKDIFGTMPGSFNFVSPNTTSVRFILLPQVIQSLWLRKSLFSDVEQLESQLPTWVCLNRVYDGAMIPL